MKEIKSEKELKDIETEKWNSNYVLDLQMISWKIRLIDGWALLIGADCSDELELYFISDKTVVEEGLELYLAYRYR